MKNTPESLPAPTPEFVEKLRTEHESGFLGFWIRQYRISYLIALALLVLGLGALFSIPKESSPNIKFGIVSIVTVFPGASPVDIDSLITDKIYKEIKDIAGAKKITSSSSLGVSSVSVELNPSTPVTEYINEVRNNIGRVSLPSDAKNPNVIEIKSQSDLVFSINLSADPTQISKEKLRILGADLRDRLAPLPQVKKISYGSELEYDVRVVIEKETLAGLGITISDVANTIRSYHRDAPIGNYGVGEKNYDFRLQGKFENTKEILEVPLVLSGGKTIRVGDIATLDRKYKDTSIGRIGGYNSPARDSVSLTVEKTESSGIFAASNAVKAAVTEALATPNFSGVQVSYSSDQADTIGDDYRELALEAITTLVLVFIVMWLFIGFRDSLFATFTLPLAFLVTFMFLNGFGYSLNFLTNFSLVLSFGIAIDTIVVIVQAASAKIRVGYEPRTAIMLALREYGVPVISGVMTTIVAFIPMMVLPGVLGKFLAYIPITIFGVLASGLILALTVNSALYLAFIKRKTTYVHDDTAIEYATDEEKQLLEYERIGKTEITDGARPLRIRMIHAGTEWYKKQLRKFLANSTLRAWSIWGPIIILILSFFPIIGGKSLAGHVGFDLFPASDNGFVAYEVRWANGARIEEIDKIVPQISDILVKYKEVKFFEITSKDTKNSTDAGISVSVTLKKITERKSDGLMTVFDFDKKILQEFDSIRTQGYKVSSKIAEGGPPPAQAVGIKLVGNSSKDLDAIIRISQDFEKELRSYEGVKNIANSSGETPGQFVFTLKKDVIALLGIPPSTIVDQVTSLLNGVSVGTITDRGEDLSIVVKYREFTQTINPDLLTAHQFKWAGKTYRLGDVVNLGLTNAIASIKRETGKITVSVWSDTEEGILATDVQAKFLAYAGKYDFPDGVSFTQGGENQENADLIQAVLTAFFLAVLAIFAILTLQFNSYKQPVIVLYSVLMSLPFVFLGLLLTGNKLSMPFGIGFIAFTGIAVNHGIILIDAININLRKGMDGFTALVEAGSSRLEPMILTTLTTCLGILPLALRDPFWAGLGFTIIFGLTACTILTLFVIKGLYYEAFMVKHHWTSRFLKIIKTPFRFVWHTFRSTPLPRKRG